MSRHADFYGKRAFCFPMMPYRRQSGSKNLSGQLIEAADGVMKDVARRDQLMRRTT
jgi:hypothetical protein